jgi:putative RNA 2'-phosphotransferase
MLTKSKTVRVSKFLSYVLRHDPDAAGVTPDAEGWVDVKELLAKAVGHGMKISRAELDEVVATSDKQRFAFSADRQRIRASQGHSIDVDLGLRPTVPPKFLYHGTVARFVPSILKSGLKKKSRQFVHLSINKEIARQVGARRGEAVILTVSAAAMHAAGHDFFLSENGVWLTKRVPSVFISHLL